MSKNWEDFKKKYVDPYNIVTVRLDATDVNLRGVMEVDPVSRSWGPYRGARSVVLGEGSTRVATGSEIASKGV